MTTNQHIIGLDIGGANLKAASVDGQAVCQGVARPDGLSLCTWVAVLDGGSVEVVVTDTDGATGSASLKLEVQAPNQAPACQLTEPADGASFGAVDTVTLRGTVQDEDALDVVFASSVDGELGDADPDAKGNVELEAGPLSVGEHELSMTATDPQGESCSASVAVTVAKEDTGFAKPDTDVPDPDTAAPKPE